MIEIKEVGESNLEDMIVVCSPEFSRESYKTGVEIKRKWLLEMLRKYGEVGYIGYFNEKPVAQLLFFPEKADPTGLKRENVLVINCIYNPHPAAQGKGIAKAMVKMLIEKARGEYEFLVIHAFHTGEFIPQLEFFERLGFKRFGRDENLYYSFSGKKLEIPHSSFWKEGADHKKRENSEKVTIFYTPVCQFSYVFSIRASEIAREINPEIKIELLDSWKNAEKFVARGRNWMLVNGIPIRPTPQDEEKFKDEIKNALF